MDDISNENNLFSLSGDIFSMYDDNFATNDCLLSYQNDLELNENSSRNQTTFEEIVNTKETTKTNDSVAKIVPTFGKQKNNDKKGVKTKKFVPPVKIPQSNQSANQTSNVGPTPLPLSPTIYPNISGNCQTHNKVDPISNSNHLAPITIENNDQMLKENTFLTRNNQDIQNYHSKIEDSRRNINKINNSDIGGVILNSLNLLNDECITHNPTQESNSDHSIVKLSQLSQSRNTSICSVVSLKTYKNLDDINSFGSHKIPEGDSFLELFKYTCKAIDPIAMDIKDGDMGINLKYAEYIKNVGVIDDSNQEAKDTTLMIKKMYPKENHMLIKTKKIN